MLFSSITITHAADKDLSENRSIYYRPAVADYKIFRKCMSPLQKNRMKKQTEVVSHHKVKAKS